MPKLFSYDGGTVRNRESPAYRLRCVVVLIQGMGGTSLVDPRCSDVVERWSLSRSECKRLSLTLSSMNNFLKPRHITWMNLSLNSPLKTPSTDRNLWCVIFRGPYSETTAGTSCAKTFNHSRVQTPEALRSRSSYLDILRSPKSRTRKVSHELLPVEWKPQPQHKDCPTANGAVLLTNT